MTNETITLSDGHSIGTGDCECGTGTVRLTAHDVLSEPPATMAGKYPQVYRLTHRGDIIIESRDQADVQSAIHRLAELACNVTDGSQ